MVLTMNTLLDVGIVLAILAAFSAYLWHVYRPGQGAAPDAPLLARFFAWLRSLLDRALARFRGAASPGPSPRPAPRPPAPRRPAGPAPAGPGPAPGPVPADLTPAEIPQAYGPLLSHIAGFEAGEDADLHVFTRGLAAGELATGEALQAQLEHCVAELGLDPVSVQGLAEYAEQKAEHAQGAMQIWQRFATVYAEVQEFVSSGHVLPKDGRFLTGEG